MALHRKARPDDPAGLDRHATIIETSVDGSALLARAQDGVQSINGGLFRVLALQAAARAGG
ncbi:MAG: hypothetical protein P4M00_12300 [Azospirillaceae bacterium]|nr:hypothetical protein [Azospirillaceae bacterium]